MTTIRNCFVCGATFNARGAGKACGRWECLAMLQRLRKVKHKYGLSAEEYFALVERADGRCESCGEPPATEGGGHQTELHVDHDHATGRVRGLLCHGCNLAIGNLRDDPVKARAAATYLEAHRSSFGNAGLLEDRPTIEVPTPTTIG